MRGSVDLAHRKRVDVSLAASASELPRLLQDMGLPPLAQGARLDARATGPLADPTASADLVVEGLGAGPRRVRRLDARVAFEHGLLRLEKLSGPAFGGRLDAHGTVQLPASKPGRRAAAPVVDLQLEARDIDLAALAPDSGVAGRVTLSADAHGPAGRADGPPEHPGRNGHSRAGRQVPGGPRGRRAGRAQRRHQEPPRRAQRRRQRRRARARRAGNPGAEPGRGAGRIPAGGPARRGRFARGGDRPRRRSPARRRARRAASDRRRDRPARRQRPGRAPRAPDTWRFAGHASGGRTRRASPFTASSSIGSTWTPRRR